LKEQQQWQWIWRMWGSRRWSVLRAFD